MNVKKHLWSLARICLPSVGFAVTCTGVYLVSMQTEQKCTWSFIPAYVMTVFGLLTMVIGVFWTLCHTMKSKIYKRRCNREPHMQIYTVERPSSYPPSYEDSQGSHACTDTVPGFEFVISEADVEMSLAPPLYSQDNSDVPDCTRSWERPPRYSQVERVQQGQVITDDQGEALSEH